MLPLDLVKLVTEKSYLASLSNQLHKLFAQQLHPFRYQDCQSKTSRWVSVCWDKTFPEDSQESKRDRSIKLMSRISYAAFDYKSDLQNFHEICNHMSSVTQAKSV